ncbi:glycerophosphocholine phosphodiesterase GPCPD1 isoform X1 [Halyomorpha halys]|uniref:glycerophosphocholine phosphodiesterase GPCPD1 isoform X1 n=2 Tax=Halyomorpha halys TaxID=286706 RepID=UPI0006D4DA51|nr:glycerophosphocholine phosphodiesterase GPCPD1 isoform X1 [Halyomorpha halys]XP_014281836.1 glycerophosphocholine phosphodiesterase GPCPD1 isoform X1 [Halyomorpha halys]XP_014281844.1 glycerophosphocholine phosphodiesterase GPCPD1 isoform X1 [Halyomorpha halys]XP_014281855.1 glycerophosphocholine phosphodiesterase GPCPD1 isoform X1 [Halyomorpha halys]XP_014281863.1 glycerophosphocholine phosphodiesterase GPCPD1 isoform X1 [Halyomorpha halys]XP_014281881.1 glycerophosphocholine phosphodieste
MMRWWNNEAYMKKKAEAEPQEEGTDNDQASDKIPYLDEGIFDKIVRPWVFRVRAEVTRGEVVCITGNCDTLGNWKHNKVLVLTQEKDETEEEGNESVWYGKVDIPLRRDITYRYVICLIVEPDGSKITDRHFIVRRWETNREPRTILKKVYMNPEEEIETMGFYDNKERIDRGWLTTETAVQLKLFNSNLNIWKTKLKGKPMNIKITLVNLSRANSISQEVNQADECLSLETMDLSDKIDNWPIIELAVLNQRERQFKFQEQFGRPFKDDEFMVFQILVLHLETNGILLDFYIPTENRREDEPPYHAGFSYILPSAMKYSEGQIVVPITSVRHRPIGEITLEYLVVKPTVNYTCDLSYSLHKQWKDTWHGLDVGHRGAGGSFRGDIKQCAEVRENTIASLKSAASHGADFVEFDVQLSRDLIPVLYHDFYVAIALRRKTQVTAEEMIQLPVKDLSMEQLQRLKGLSEAPTTSKVLHFRDNDELPDDTLYHIDEFNNKSKYSDDHLEEHQPFPTLQQALEILDPSVGFNVEIKWTMQLKDGTYELYHPFDLNLYLDTVLEVVLKHAKTRNIIFSCFHPDICSMIRLKQNRYPVMFLTQGITDKYPAYHDPRCQNVPMAVHFAVNMDILGINVHTEELLRDSSQIALVKRAGLVLFCWGDDNNDTETIKHLKDLGIHAVIYDKIDQRCSKEVKESIFRLEARESERIQIRAAAERASVDEYLHPTPERQNSMEAKQNFVMEAAALNETMSFPSQITLWTEDGLGHTSS